MKGNEHVTPFIYLHKEENEGRGTETILYYNEGLDELIQVPFVEDGTMPETNDAPVIADNSPLRYVKPTQGFRVMSGGTTLHAVEPGLIGSITYQYTTVSYAIRGNNNSHQTPTTSGEVTMSIALDPSDPYKVELNNLVNHGNVEAIIDPEQGTITIPNGTPIRFIDGSWKPSGDKTLYIYGCTGPTAILSDYYTYYSNYKVKYATNLGSDVVFTYTKYPDGSIKIEQQNAFVIYTDDMYEAIIEGETPNYLYYQSADNCIAWYVYEGISSTKNNSLGDGFILSDTELDEIEGVYSCSITKNQDVPNVETGEYSGIILQHIKGTYDQVLIRGIFPESTDDVIGTISKNGNQIKLKITQGQTVKKSDNPDNPSESYHLYLTNIEDPRTFAGIIVLEQKYRYDVDLTWNAMEEQWASTDNNRFAQISKLNNNSAPRLFMNNGNKFVLTRKFGLDSDNGDVSIENEIFTGQQNLNLLALDFTPEMFVTNPNINPSAAPQRRKVQAKEASSLITITAQGEEYSGSTLLVKSEKGRAGYSNREDAPLSDISEQRFCMASLAGEQVVGVNVFNETDIIPLYIQGEAQKLTLSFGNIEALGWEAELYDAVEESSTDISKGECKIEIQLHGDQPAGRFFIRKKSGGSTPGEVTSMEKEKEWAPQAWSPTKGTIVIMSQAADMQAEVMVTNVAGQSVVCEKASSIHTLRNLLPGVYVVQLRIGNSYWNKKVLVN